VPGPGGISVHVKFWVSIITELDPTGLTKLITCESASIICTSPVRVNLKVKRQVYNVPSLKVSIKGLIYFF
jgi:hypothetical protein